VKIVKDAIPNTWRLLEKAVWSPANFVTYEPDSKPSLEETDADKCYTLQFAQEYCSPVSRNNKCRKYPAKKFHNGSILKDEATCSLLMKRLEFHTDIVHPAPTGKCVLEHPSAEDMLFQSTRRSERYD
jgi:hypothetical protein